MSDTNTEIEAATSTPWWERLVDGSQESGKAKSSFRLALIAAILVAAGLLLWLFLDSKKTGDADALSRALTSAQKALPVEYRVQRGADILGGRGGAVYSPNPDPIFYSEHQQTLGVLAEYQVKAGAANNFATTSGALLEPEEAKKYVDEVEMAIAELETKKGDFAGSDQDWLYWQTIQSLHFFAARNSTDQAKRIGHFDAQLAALSEIESKHKDHMFFQMRPDTSRRDMTVVALWRDLAEKERAHAEKVGTRPDLTADSGLKATVTLANNSVIELEFYSRTAPKAVAAFLAMAKAGHFNGTAVSRVDAENKSLTFGNPFTKLAADRKFLWDKNQKFAKVPSDPNPLLPIEKGTVALRAQGASANTFEFEIFLETPESAPRAAVFARVTKGLDALEPWLRTEVHDESGVTINNIPRVRLGVTSVTTEGAIQFPSVDSWKPVIDLPEVPEVNDAEKAFNDAIAIPTDETPVDGETENDEDN